MEQKAYRRPVRKLQGVGAYFWHVFVMASSLGFVVGIADNALYVDPLPYSSMEIFVMIAYSSGVYASIFAFLGLLFSLLLILFWSRPVLEVTARRAGTLLIATCLASGFFFLEIGMWYYRSASYKPSLWDYLNVNELALIGLVSLITGGAAALFFLQLTRFLRYLQIPIAVFVITASLFWVSIVIRPSGYSDAAGPVSNGSAARRVALIGIDGVGWDLLLPWIDEGKLPHMQELMEEGVWGVLRSRHPTRSPAIWTGVVTGKKRAKHGIYDFFMEEDGKKVASGSHHRRVKALWNILSENGKNVWIVDWMTTYPPETVNGVMVTNLLENQATPVYNQPDSVYPDKLRPVIERLTRPHRMERVRYPYAGFNDDQYARLERKYRNEVDVVEAVGLYGCRQDWDLFALYTHSTDAVLHHFWKFMEPQRFDHDVYRLTPDNIARFSGTILKHLQRVDLMLGRLLECIGSDATVIVLSDHGQEAGVADGRSRRPGEIPLLSGHHNNDGILIMRGGGIRQGAVLTQKTVDTPMVEIGKMLNDKLAGVDVDRMLRNLRVLDYLDILDIAPTVLYLLGLPVAKDMDGRVLTRSFDQIHLAHHPVQFIETYETESLKAPSRDQSSGLTKEREERLRSLGYIQ